MTGDGVSSRAERIQAGRHRPGWTADAGTGEEKSVVVAGPGAAAVGLRREKHADSELPTGTTSTRLRDASHRNSRMPDGFTALR